MKRLILTVYLSVALSGCAWLSPEREMRLLGYDDERKAWVITEDLAAEWADLFRADGKVFVCTPDPERGIAFVDDATIERAITLVSIERARKELEK